MTSAVPGTLAALLCFFSLTVNAPGAFAQEATVKPEVKAQEKQQVQETKPAAGEVDLHIINESRDVRVMVQNFAARFHLKITSVFTPPCNR